MTNAAVIEVMLLRWSDNQNGRTVTFLLPDDGGDHPFKGLKCGPANGDRLAVSVARIADDETQEPVTPPEPALTSATKERRAWATLTPTVQAGIRCQDPIFQAYVIEQRKFEEVDDMEDNAACFVRRQCNVNTRGALATNEKAATVWRSIDDDFIGWKHAESM